MKKNPGCLGDIGDSTTQLMWELQVAAGTAKQLPNKASAAGYFPCFCYGSQIFLFFGMKGFWMIHWKSSFDDVRSKHIFLEIDKLPKSFW